jgi:hypothetical protein
MPNKAGPLKNCEKPPRSRVPDIELIQAPGEQERGRLIRTLGTIIRDIQAGKLTGETTQVISGTDTKNADDAEGRRNHGQRHPLGKVADQAAERPAVIE